VTVVERLEAAIAKLERLKADSTPGPWGGSVNILGVTRLMDAERYIIAELWEAENVEYRALSNLELILALHATIDAQLAILRHAIDEYEPRDDSMSFITNDGLLLADAILWVNS